MNRIRVCIVVKNQLWNDARVKKEALTLSGAGYEVRIICKPEEGRPERELWGDILVLRPPRDSALRRRLRGSAIELERGGWTPSMLRRLIGLLRRSGLRRLLTKPAMLLKYEMRLLRAAMRTRAGVYHSSDLDTLLICWICSILRRSRLVYDSHELWLESHRFLYETPLIGRLWYRILEPLLIRRADMVIAVTGHRGDHMARHYPRRMRVSPLIVENCPDVPEERESPVDLRGEMGLPGDAIVVLYQGILSPSRGLEELIEAAPLVGRREPRVRFVLMGHDVIRSQLERLAGEAGVADRVLFHDPVPSELLPRYTAAADMGLILFRNSCLNHYYSLPNKLYEYMMAGIPLIASGFPEMSAVFERERCGIGVDPSSPTDIARAVLELSGDPERRRSMGDAGRRAVVERHNWSIQAKKLVDAYGSMVS